MSTGFSNMKVWELFAWNDEKRTGWSQLKNT